MEKSTFFFIWVMCNNFELRPVILVYLTVLPSTSQNWHYKLPPSLATIIPLIQWAQYLISFLFISDTDTVGQDFERWFYISLWLHLGEVIAKFGLRGRWSFKHGYFLHTFTIVNFARVDYGESLEKFGLAHSKTNLLKWSYCIKIY